MFAILKLHALIWQSGDNVEILPNNPIAKLEWNISFILTKDGGFHIRMTAVLLAY